MSIPSRDPIYGLAVLAAAADWTETLAKRHVHTAYVPITILTILHTVRVSHATRQISGGKNSRLGLFQSVVLDQIVLFAGSSILGTSALTALALGMPLPILIAPFAIALYSSVHILTSITGIGDVLLALHAHPVIGLVIDLVFCAVDALARSEGIVNLGFGMLAAHPDSRISSALSAKLFTGALLSGGMPLVAQGFQLSSPVGAWGPTAPAWLQKPALLFFPDLIGGVVVALVHVILAHGMHADTHHTLASALSTAFSWRAPKTYIPYTPYLSLRETKVVDSVVLFSVLAVPAVIRRMSLLKPSRATTSASGRRNKSTRAARSGRGKYKRE